MFMGNDCLVGGGCRSGMGGCLFVVLSSCCVVRVVAVRGGWERGGGGTNLNDLDVAQLPHRLHHPSIVVVRVVVHVSRGGCGWSVTAVGGGGHWRDGWGSGNGWRRWWWLGGKDC